MKRKTIRIFFLITIACIAFTSYLKGCNSTVYPKQYGLSLQKKDSLDSLYTVDYRDSIIKIAAGPQYKRGNFHEIIYGVHHREIWSLPVKMNVFDIGTDKGGFKVVKRGGNMQTLNLRLQNTEGKRYVLRTVDKDQSKALPYFLQNKVLVFIIRDQTSALNPYGALVVPKLAEAVDVLHTNPELVFIPYDKRFNEFADEFEGRVALLEEYPDKSWINSETFKHAENIVSTTNVLAGRFSSQKVKIDEKAFAKARLLDLLINDWDRHVGQWEWAEYKEGDKSIYRPIPRDRDMTFYNFNTGLLPKMVLAFNPKFQTFDYEYKNIKGLVKNARYIDRTIINSITQEEFIAIANDMKTALTDAVITDAVKEWPEEVFEVLGAETISKLKVRRNQLDKIAKDYYEILFKETTIVGTDKEEKFTVERMDDDHTSVTMESKKGEVLYHHVFNHKITKEVSLYGLDGSDEFIIKGKTKEGILINVYGGEQYDKIKDESSVKGYLRKTRIYDTKLNNEIEAGEETENLTTYDPDVLYFDRVGIRKK